MDYEEVFFKALDRLEVFDCDVDDLIKEVGLIECFYCKEDGQPPSIRYIKPAQIGGANAGGDLLCQGCWEDAHRERIEW